MNVLENSLYLLMSQAVLFLRQDYLTSRDKQLLKRELNAEVVSCIVKLALVPEFILII